MLPETKSMEILLPLFNQCLPLTSNQLSHDSINSRHIRPCDCHIAPYQFAPLSPWASQTEGIVWNADVKLVNLFSETLSLNVNSCLNKAVLSNFMSFSRNVKKSMKWLKQDKKMWYSLFYLKFLTNKMEMLIPFSLLSNFFPFSKCRRR